MQLIVSGSSKAWKQYSTHKKYIDKDSKSNTFPNWLKKGGGWREVSSDFVLKLQSAAVLSELKEHRAQKKRKIEPVFYFSFAAQFAREK